MNTGGGAFVQQTEEDVGTLFRDSSAGLPDLVLADLDASGTLDAILSLPELGELSVLLNQGGAVFAPQVHVPLSVQPVRLFAGDLDGGRGVRRGRRAVRVQGNRRVPGIRHG